MRRRSIMGAAMSLAPAALAAAILCGASSAAAMDYVTVQRDGTAVEVAGKTIVEAQDGGLVLLGRDGAMWILEPKEIAGRRRDEAAYVPYTAEELGPRLLAELPRGFETYETAHYLVCHNTSRGYAQWCGALFERLMMAFTNYWTRKGFELAEPDHPLVAIVFSDRQAYVEYARNEVGDAVDSIVAYYSLKTNRMVMYDLTGVGRLGDPSRTVTVGSQINRILSRPGAAETVSTIVHEATHQIAFNCGLHTRMSDCPVWFGEGIATYFETPDLSSSRGWSNIGSVNRLRLRQFYEYMPRRPPGSLEALIANDKRLRDAKTATDAYAESWALTFFLIRQRPKEYIAYLRTLSAKKPYQSDDEKTRLADFQAAFGDIATLDREFVRYMARGR